MVYKISLFLCVFVPELLASRNGHFHFTPYDDGYHRSPETPEIDERVGMPYLLDFSYRAENQHEVERHSDWSNDRLRAKRAPRKSLIPITRLIVDPKAQVDFPKTINNFGAVTRQTFEDDKSPMYHVRNLMGSAKNTMLAAMRIIPQNLIIPSDYRIAKLGSAEPQDQNIVGDINFGALGGEPNPADPLNIATTFEKVGSVLRESVKSGQDAMVHMGNMAQDAKNVLHTAHYTLPKVIMPYHKGIHVERQPRLRLPSPSKKQAVLLSPRIVDVNEEFGRGQNEPAYVKMGHLLDALGVSDPRVENHVVDKVVFEERKLPHVTQFSGPTEKTVKATLSNLESAKQSVGASSLKDFLVKMKQGIKENAKNRKLEAEEKIKQLKQKNVPKAGVNVESKSSFSEPEQDEEIVTSQHVIAQPREELVPSAENEENVEMQWISRPELLKPFMGRATKTEMDNFLNGSRVDPVQVVPKGNASRNNEKVGVQWIAQPELLKPFMGRATKTEMDDYLKTEGAESAVPQGTGPENKEKVGAQWIAQPELLKPFMGRASKTEMDDFLKTDNLEIRHKNNPNLGGVLGADSMLNFEEMYNLSSRNGTSNDTTVGTSLHLSGPMMTPFMGFASQDAVTDMLKTYNNDMADYNYDEGDIVFNDYE